MRTRKPKQLSLDYYESKAQRHAMPLSYLTVIFAIVLVASVFASVALADAPVTLNWSLPTHCTNDEPIGVGKCGALMRVQLRCGTTAGGAYEFLWGRDAADGTSDTRIYPDGEFYCVLRAKNEGGWSGDSGEIHFTVTTPPPDPVVPNPPSVVTIEVAPVQ